MNRILICFAKGFFFNSGVLAYEDGTQDDKISSPTRPSTLSARSDRATPLCLGRHTGRYTPRSCTNTPSWDPSIMISSTSSATTYGIEKFFSIHSFMNSIYAVYSFKKSVNRMEIEHNNWCWGWGSFWFQDFDVLEPYSSARVPAFKADGFRSASDPGVPETSTSNYVSTSTSIIVFNFHSIYILKV